MLIAGLTYCLCVRNFRMYKTPNTMYISFKDLEYNESGKVYINKGSMFEIFEEWLNKKSAEIFARLRTAHQERRNTTKVHKSIIRWSPLHCWFYLRVIRPNHAVPAAPLPPKAENAPATKDQKKSEILQKGFAKSTKPYKKAKRLLRGSTRLPTLWVYL